MDHMSLLSLLLISMPEAVLITMLGFQLTGLKATLPQLLVIGTVQAILSYFIRLSPLPFGLHSIVHIVLYIFVLRIVTGIFFRAIIIAALLGSTIFVSLEAVILPTLLSLTGYSLSEVINSQSIRITFFLPEAAAILIIIIACNQYNFSLLDFSPGVNQLVEKSSKTSIWEKSSFNLYVLVLLPVQLLAILNLVLYVSQTGTFPNKYFSLFIALFSLVVGTITVLSMGAVKRISELKEKELEAQKARETIAQLDKIIRAIRKQRHDFNHHLQTVYGLLEVDSPEMARDYVRQIFLDISTPAELVKTDKPGLSALLYAKAGLAEAKGINFSAQVDGSLRDIPLTTMEVNSLLGNLLDNAIEAAAAYSGACRSVRLEISQEPGKYVFIIANTGDPIPRETLNRMCDLHYTTKEKRRGLGLTIVKEIIERYVGSINVAYCDDEAVFTVHIPDKGVKRA